MSLQELTRRAFASDGCLASTVEAFTPRAGQTEMADAVARTIDQGGVLVVEAGTGIGKTFSYLVPALLSGTRVLLSTATKNLQDQLFGRDLPALIKALGLPVRIALLKGRSSYLCRHRLELARHDAGFSGREVLRALAAVEEWALVTHSGDLAELSGLDERSPVIPAVTSSRENCLGSQCPQFRTCHVNLARREAMSAELVVINHHLFFADLAVRESGLAELLPSVRTVIFDEAHQLNETGVQFLGQQLSTGQLLDFARDLLGPVLLPKRGLLDWPGLASAIEQAARDLRLLAAGISAGTKLPWMDLSPEQVDASAWGAALERLGAACTGAMLALDRGRDGTPDLERLFERACTFVEQLGFFANPCGVDSARWVDVAVNIRMIESPLDIAHAVQTRIIRCEQEDQSRRSWIFTSATLGDDPNLTWFTEPSGLSGAEVLKIASPFDYEHQAALYVPPELPKPSDPKHSARVAELVARTAPLIAGRTLVLTTTLRALRAISEALTQHFSNSRELEILVQGQRPKRELMERFRHGNEAGSAGCILVASASFWEGVDIPGDALQMLVIDKLPFPPPNDPWVQARSKRMEAAGRSVFNEYLLPEAAIMLKQGAGRLIRRESDHGILIVGDTRLTTMGYGKRLLRALPAMRRINSEPELMQALEALTRPSTKDPNCL